MKKIIIVILCLGVIGAGIGIYLHMQKKGESIEAILPGDALLYVHLNDVEENLATISSMPLWKVIAGIDYDSLIKKSSLNPQQMMFINLIRGQFSEVLDNPLAKRMFGREVAFALFLPQVDVATLAQDMKALNPQVIEKLFSGLFLVTRIDPDLQFAEFISRFFKQYGANVSQGMSEYKGETIRTITLTDIGVKFGAVRLNDLLVMGIGETVARTVVDVVKGDKRSLAQDPRFLKAQAAVLDPSGMDGFVNLEVILQTIKNQTEKILNAMGGQEQDLQVRTQWQDGLAKVSGFKTFAFSSQLTPLMKFNGYVFFNPEEFDPDYAPLYTCPAGPNETIGFVPREVLGYQWSNCFKLDHYWRQIKKELARTEAPASKIGEFETKIGLSVEGDILPTFGDEIGGYLSDIQIGGLFPIPKFLFFIEIKNKAKAEQMLARVKEQPFAMLQEENHRGVNLKYIALPLGADVQPSYCFLKNYLLIASSRQLIKNSIDASGNSALSLSAHPEFKEINAGLTEKNRSVTFIRVSQVIDRIKGVLGWSNQWVSAQERKAQAFRMGSEKPLEEAKDDVERKGDELKEIRDSIILLEDEIWNLEGKGGDVTDQQTELGEWKNQFDTKRDELTAARERREQLEGIVQASNESAPDPALRQLYLDKVIYPLLDGLKTIKSYGLSTTLSGDAFESSAVLKLEN